MTDEQNKTVEELAYSHKVYGYQKDALTALLTEFHEMRELLEAAATIDIEMPRVSLTEKFDGCPCCAAIARGE